MIKGIFVSGLRSVSDDEARGLLTGSFGVAGLLNIVFRDRTIKLPFDGAAQ